MVVVAAALVLLVVLVSLARCAPERCESAFLLLDCVAAGYNAAQICAVGSVVSLLGIVKRGVSHREKGEGGS